MTDAVKLDRSDCTPYTRFWKTSPVLFTMRYNSIADWSFYFRINFGITVTESPTEKLILDYSGSYGPSYSVDNERQLQTEPFRKIQLQLQRETCSRIISAIFQNDGIVVSDIAEIFPSESVKSSYKDCIEYLLLPAQVWLAFTWLPARRVLLTLFIGCVPKRDYGLIR